MHWVVKLFELCIIIISFSIVVILNYCFITNIIIIIIVVKHVFVFFFREDNKDEAEVDQEQLYQREKCSSGEQKERVSHWRHQNAAVEVVDAGRPVFKAFLQCAKRHIQHGKPI